MTDQDKDQKTRLRLLKLLSKGPADCGAAASDGNVMLENDAGDRIVFGSLMIATLVREGLVCQAGSTLRLSPEGESALRRVLAEAASFQSQHRELDSIEIELPEGRQWALINLSESPLGQLVRRKTKAGEPFLSQGEFVAGERLRSDYTRGQIMPRMGANWEASVASGRRGAGGGGLTDLTDAALAARLRVDRAIDAVGPELSGVLIDVCCFLKGLELVETERGWPVRSAKIVLKSALGVLARHYNPQGGVAGRHKVLHWGAADYRPRIG